MTSELGDLEEKIWTTADGTDIPVKDMGDSHLDNCVRFLNRKINNGDTVVECGTGGGFVFDSDPDIEKIDIEEEISAWIKVFEDEIKRRKELK